MTIWTDTCRQTWRPIVDGELTPRAAESSSSTWSSADGAGRSRSKSGTAWRLELLPPSRRPMPSGRRSRRDSGNAGDRRRSSVALGFRDRYVVALAGAAIWRSSRAGTHGKCDRSRGDRPSAGGRSAAPVRLGSGEWIETDAGSRATVKIGEIGSVEVGPNTRVRVVATSRREHRLALERGQIRATISAPPKFFFVDTASGTAVDLGCEYALSTDEDGPGCSASPEAGCPFSGTAWSRWCRPERVVRRDHRWDRACRTSMMRPMR